ncbi:hypothetical protein P153DRAFT_389367 [Dothidotthia symphoricarpi CBS 119687]|uniref:Uncharacterized protein n=1 Tax=Dothidotthia symphoricarpi CBS 119687 TaxID=1392245 RepID=A0A6A6A291_9PLEO|nr:uncharacterized protein P153DRAFT_389367 [Dothidotthia symphoricarpi CBS 119687]KAF2125920.1 hypothetical protein P153DRAFT_389367 [Dothidotthia symphoricarpi CBS 119687]
MSASEVLSALHSETPVELLSAFLANRPVELLSAFLSVQPLEPVLIFTSAEDAALFRLRCKQGRILPDLPQTWVYLPMPEGLLRVRTAHMGNVAFEFSSGQAARGFNAGIKGLGEIRGDPGEDSIVNLGMENY